MMDLEYLQSLPAIADLLSAWEAGALPKGAGVAGALLYLFNYAGLQMRLIDGNGVTYTLIGMTAACLVLIGLTDQFNLGAAIIQVSWLVLGTFGLTASLIRRRLEAAVPAS